MILYFSGTGNSAFAARRLASELGDEALDLFEKIRTGDHGALHSECPWVVVCPTYGWQIPHILRDFLKDTPLTGHDKIYFVMTCGDDIGASAKYAGRLCEEKKLHFMGCLPVRMPENYLAMFDTPCEEKADHIIRKALPVIDSAAGSIRKEEPFEQTFTLTDALKSSVVNTVFCTFLVKDKKFRVSENCLHCGKCAAVCPAANITVKRGIPVWNGHCVHCMACISSCPVRAIEYGKESVGRRIYRCPDRFSEE